MRDHSQFFPGNAASITIAATAKPLDQFEVSINGEPVDTTDPVTNAPLKVLVIDTEGIGAPTADATFALDLAPDESREWTLTYDFGVASSGTGSPITSARTPSAR